jgi:hypothetical protein
MREYIVEGHIGSVPKTFRVFATSEGFARKQARDDHPGFADFRCRLA